MFEMGAMQEYVTEVFSRNGSYRCLKRVGRFLRDG